MAGSWLISAFVAQAQQLTFDTLAGYAGQGSADGLAATARFNSPGGVAVDGSGNWYIADTANHTIRMITSGGTVSTLAGQAGISGSGDGTGSGARFNQPQGVAVDGAGNVYVADTGNHTIRKITAGGVVTTLAGLAGTAGSSDGTGSAVRFYEPEAVAVNAGGTLVFVADTWNHTIRQVTSAGAVTTLAGSASNFGSADGTGGGALFYQPQGVAVDSAGNIYVGDTANGTIRKVTSGGAVTTLAGSAGIFGSADGTGSGARFYQPEGVAVDSSGNVYVADTFNNTIRKVTSGGTVNTLAGSAGLYGIADGSGSAARFFGPQGVAVSGTTVYVADTGNGTIRQVNSGEVVTTLAGSPSTGSADGTGGNARFYWPEGAAVDSSGNAYVGDTFNHTIRKVTPAGVVTTLAGVAGVPGTSDGTGSSAKFNGPQGVAVDGSGNVYVADTVNNTIRKVTSGGAVSTLAGTAGVAGIADGTGANALFNGPQALALDGSGNLYVADTGSHTIRKVTSGGAVTTFAGFPGSSGCSDGTGAAVGTNTARFYSPAGVVLDTAGNVYVADTGNHTVRKITAAGVVSTVAGLPGVWGSTDGTNTLARFFLPQGITIQLNTNLYVADSGNYTIRQLVLSGTNCAVTTVAGQVASSGDDDGTGSAAQFYYPAGISANSSGAFVVADSGNDTLRAAGFSLSNAPLITVQPQPQTVNQGQDASFSVSATGAAPLYYQWLFNGGGLTSATNSSYTRTNAQPADAGSYSVIVSNSLGPVTSSNALLTVIVAPVITNLPQSLTLTQGLDATFTVAASGSVPFTYQWSFNSGNISGGTGSSYTRTNIQPADAGTYSVVVSNPAGSATSSPPATLTVIAVPTPPSIASQPQNRTVGQGTNATFSVTALGSTNLYYQWSFNGTNLSGATGTSYTVVGSQPSDAGSYLVLVTNAYGSTPSSNAVLTVIVPPLINVQPLSQLVAVSNNVSFTVGLSQGTAPGYQWSKNGTAISGATQATYELSSILWSNAGTYSVVVSNLAGAQTSAGATLTVEQAAFTFFDGFEGYQLGSLDNNTIGGPNTSASNPWSATSTTAQSQVTNSSTGVTPHGGSKMTGVITTLRQDYLDLPYRLNAGQLYYGNFMCDWWFYDPFGLVSRSSASNYVDYVALGSYSPVPTTSDVSSGFTQFYQRMSLGTFNTAGYNVSNYQARIIGGTGSFGSQNSWYNTTALRSVGWHHARIVLGIPNASGYAPVSMYIDNMTNATVTSPTSGTNTGFNLIELNHAIVSGGLSGYYDDLTFRAANDPWIVEQPLSQTVKSGQSAYFNTVAVGTAYQWQLNGTNISGATTSAYALASAAVTDAGSYACVITGANGTVATSNAVLTVNGPPVITAQPVSLTVTQGQNAAFSVTAAGTDPLSYQWQFDSTNISGATASSYTVTNAQAASAGSYSVVVTNGSGGTTSSVATLSVIVPVSITTQPVSQTNLQGTCSSFSVVAAGTAPLFYQWQWNSTIYPPDTTSTSFTACNAGTYSVTVSNQAGIVVSDAVTLTLTNPPPPLPGHFDLIGTLGDGSVQLGMSGSPGTNYTLLFSTNWTDWTSLGALPSGSGSFQFTDTLATNSSQRIYRLRLGGP